MSERNRKNGSEVDEALSALIDGELPEEEARELRSALANDPALRERFEALEAVGEALRELQPPVPADDLLARIESRIAAQDPRQGEGGASRDWRWPLAAAVALLLFTGWFVQSTEEQEVRIVEAVEEEPVRVAPAPDLAPELATPEIEEPPVEVARVEAPVETAPEPAIEFIEIPPDAELDEASDVELAIAFELETLRDLEVIEELDLLEALLALEERERASAPDRGTS